MWAEILVVVALILINGFFAMSELALVSSRPGELRRRAEKGSRGAKLALQMIADPSLLLSASQIGITLVGIVAGAYSGTTLGAHFAEWLDVNAPILGSLTHGIAMTVVVGLITYLSLVVGELVPKRLAMQHAETIAIRVAPFMRWVAIAFGPLVSLLRVSTNSLLRLLGQRPQDTKSVTEEEVRALIAEGALAGVIEPVEKAMLDRVMRLADRPVGSIMTPRPDVIWLDADEPLDQWRRRMADAPHSRFPVARGSLDELIGILDTRRILERLLANEPFDPLALVTPAPVVHEGTRAPRILEMFKQIGAPMVVVLDEYGGFEGIVTMTDLMEAIAGEMPSEGSDEESSAVRREDGSWLMDGMIAIEEAESLTGLSGMGEEGDFHTLAGFVLSQLAHLPQIGEHFSWSGWNFEVVDMDARRIDRVLLTPPSTDSETSGSGV
ncbi:MAG: HlyC/CorC family transporter [Rhodospirillaceae bacterium]|nr:HlyC/CorC family transporter [Rhodospirillales bacterium]